MMGASTQLQPDVPALVAQVAVNRAIAIHALIGAANVFFLQSLLSHEGVDLEAYIAFLCQVLDDRLREAARQEPKPDLLVLAHRLTPYERVAQILAKASRAGLVRVGFALDPR